MKETTRTYLQDLKPKVEDVVTSILDYCEEQALEGLDYANISVEVQGKRLHEVLTALKEEHRLTVEVTAVFSKNTLVEISWD